MWKVAIGNTISIENRLFLKHLFANFTMTKKLEKLSFKLIAFSNGMRMECLIGDLI